MEKNNIKSVLVTGALGHIGSRLIRELDLAVGSKIIMLDNLESQRYCSLFNLPDKFDYEFIEADVRTVDFGPILEQVDAVIHLAALTNAEGTFDKVKEVESVNLEGLKRVADACAEKNVRLLFPSTTSVYGSAENVVDEQSQVVPQSPYAESKLAAEKYLQGLKAKGLKFVICRFGTIFGFASGIRFHTAVNKFTWQALTGKAVSVWKTAYKQRRPYLYLGDCVAAVNFILEKDLFNGETYNVLTSNFTVEEIVGAIKTYTPKLTVDFVDSKIMNQLSYDVSDKKFRSLGFKPKGDLAEGIGEVFAKLSAQYYGN
jgi:UDP-glucose 4-epimerase